MPRYFFHRTDGFVEHDDTGTVFKDVAEARVAAVIFAGETLRDKPDYVWQGQELRVEVTDEQGRLILTVVSLAIDAPASQPLAQPPET